MYKVFSQYLEIVQKDRAEAVRIATLNAAAVIDTDTQNIIADYRTPESEADERG